MVKTQGPVFSLEASGKLGGALVYSKWKGRPYVRTLVKPANPKSALQVSMRAMFKFLSQQWASVSSADQATWSDKAEQLVASEFNAYMSTNQERWRSFLGPSEVTPVTAAGTQGVPPSGSATAGVREITLDFTGAGTANDGWGVTIHRDLSTSFTPSISNCIAVVPFTANANFLYVDGPLDPDQYCYNFHCFTDEGLLDPTPLGEVNATVV